MYKQSVHPSSVLPRHRGRDEIRCVPKEGVKKEPAKSVHPWPQPPPTLCQKLTKSANCSCRRVPALKQLAEATITYRPVVLRHRLVVIEMLTETCTNSACAATPPVSGHSGADL